MIAIPRDETNETANRIDLVMGPIAPRPFQQRQGRPRMLVHHGGNYPEGGRREPRESSLRQTAAMTGNVILAGRGRGRVEGREGGDGGTSRSSIVATWGRYDVP